MKNKRSEIYVVGFDASILGDITFIEDSKYNDLPQAMIRWQKLCSEISSDTDVYIKKQITETIVAREVVTNTDKELEKWRVFDQS